MGENSKIEWTDHTFNPWRGCTKVSPGCAHCYAESLSKRNPKVLGEWGAGKPRVLAAEAQWKLPLKWNAQPMMTCVMPDGSLGHRRARVFCASLADWLDDEVPIEWLGRLLSLIVQTPNLDWLLLTKRPENLRLRMQQICKELHGRVTLEEAQAKALAAAFGNGGGTIMDNVWFGVTVENQEMADKRVPLLLDVPAVVRFVSCEPLLGPVDLTTIKPRFRNIPCSTNALAGITYWPDNDMDPENPINWVIAGGESGPSARPMHPDWALSLRDQCAAEEVPFLFKQWGNWRPGGVELPCTEAKPQYCMKPNGEISWWVGNEDTVINWSENYHEKDCPIVNLGKSEAGRLLDGVEHNGFPSVKGGELE